MSDTSKAVKKQPVYNCQRCKNHGLVAPRRAHQRQCPFKLCPCRLCQLIDHRRIVMRSRNQIHQSEGMLPYPRMTECRPVESLNATSSEKKSRKPRCFLCSGHGKDEVLKDHKRRGCPYEYCPCNACELGRQYRRLMAIQTKQRRDQTRDDGVQIVEIKERDTPSTTPPMMLNNSADNKKTHKKKGFLIEDILAQKKEESFSSISSHPTFLALPELIKLPLTVCPTLTPLSILNCRPLQHTLDFLKFSTKFDKLVDVSPLQ